MLFLVLLDNWNIGRFLLHLKGVPLEQSFKKGQSPISKLEYWQTFLALMETLNPSRAVFYEGAKLNFEIGRARSSVSYRLISDAVARESQNFFSS